jgi:thiamine-phosphate pyrophosphorylase
MSKNELFYKLMLVTNRQKTPIDDYLEFIKTCSKAGITSVQLREKNQTPEALLEFGKKLKHILDPLQIPLIVNDNIELALKLNASGVHLGQTDGDPELARALLGPNKIIGVSIDTEENLIRANQLPIDYVGIGAIFPTANKHNVATIWGTQGLSQLSSRSKHPIIGIGGINESNAAEILSSGACGIAVIGALHDAEDPTITTQNLRHIIQNRGKTHVA